MKIQRTFLLLAALVTIFALTACDVGNLIALGGKPTPTRTPRPTFTPRPSFSPTPEDTATPQATDTPIASPTLTRVATATRAAVVVPKTPTKPAAPPPPQFAWLQKQALSVTQGPCPAGPGVYEIKGRIWSGDYVSDIHVVVLDKSGAIALQTDSWGPQTMNPEWGVSCFEEKNSYNYQIDLSAARERGPLTIRLTRGKNDPTPISTDVRIDLPSGGGRWYIDWVK